MKMRASDVHGDMSKNAKNTLKIKWSSPKSGIKKTIHHVGMVYNPLNIRSTSF